MLMEGLGKRFARGAKEEIIPAESSIDWDKVIRAGIALLELGAFVMAVFSGGSRAKSESTSTIIINNYIGKEK